MSLLRPLPPGTTHLLNSDGRAFLPPFVRARLEYLSNCLEWEDETCFTYYEVQGKLSNGHYTMDKPPYISPIHLWIASDDDCMRSFYVGGSSSWLCPNSHYLFFDEIDPMLLPEKLDRHEWWCIQYEEDIKVIKILVCAPEEIKDDFPDGV